MTLKERLKNKTVELDLATPSHPSPHDYDIVARLGVVGGLGTFSEAEKEKLLAEVDAMASKSVGAKLKVTAERVIDSSIVREYKKA